MNVLEVFQMIEYLPPDYEVWIQNDYDREPCAEVQVDHVKKIVWIR
jgi:hypothetical protein